MLREGEMLTELDKLLQVAERLKSHLGEGAIEEVKVHNGEVSIVVNREVLTETLSYLRDQEHFEMLVDATAVDYLPLRGEPRFEVVYHLLSLSQRIRLRVKVRVKSDDAWVPTVCYIYPNANPYEREIWDMFGIHIDGHPNLKRILTYEEFPGHPLRKDFPLFWRPGMPLEKAEERFEEW
ncbi:MAG: NADH-quinone oxidoreductase subunit C [Candidatus Fervidibacter sp.]|uniref:NADH-quinone oxidoreductase subunit C n=1 Tax=Candidatus Fervidibacter sp. TaxID=3100871 RepID=UPI00404954A5